MAKKTTKKRSKKKVGRPSKGPSIAVNMRMSAQLVKKIDRLRTRLEKELTRTEVVERALQKAFKAEEELLDEIIRTS